MRVVLCFLIALVAAPAWAEWQKVAESDRAVTYLDPATIRKNGDIRKVWQIQDLKKREKDGTKSRRSFNEYDCKEQRKRLLSFSAHSERMAAGNTLFSNSEPEDWIPVPPSTSAEAALEIVCAK